MEVDQSDLIFSWLILVQNELVQNKASTDEICRSSKTKVTASIMEDPDITKRHVGAFQNNNSKRS